MIENVTKLQPIQIIEPFLHRVTKATDDDAFISRCLIYVDVLAYLSKLNLVISFLQIEFLRGFKWANYE